MPTDLQASQRKAKADPIAALDIAVDDDRGDWSLVQPGTAWAAGTKIVMYVDVGCTQIVDRLAQACVGMCSHFGSQVTRIEQHEFGGVGFGRAYQSNEVTQCVGRSKFERASCLKGLLLKVIKQVAGEGMTALVRPANNQDTHDIALVIIRPERMRHVADKPRKAATREPALPRKFFATIAENMVRTRPGRWQAIARSRWRATRAPGNVPQ